MTYRHLDRLYLWVLTVVSFGLALAAAPFALFGGERFGWVGWAAVLGFSGGGLVMLVGQLATVGVPRSRAEHGLMTLGLSLVIAAIAVLTRHADAVGDSWRVGPGIAAMLMFGAGTLLTGWNAIKPGPRRTD